MSIFLADYLFRRLRQLRIQSLHGVPGDYNLELLDHVEPAGLRWIGDANELNAAYAADGYARMHGISALVTTFGVGELSAVNAIAGAYAERAPVVHIVGTPSKETQLSRARVHHTFNDGEYGRFAKIYELVTVARAALWDADKAPEQIDDVLAQCLAHSRPVYIQIPTDLVKAPVSAARLEVPVQPAALFPADAAQEESTACAILAHMQSAKQPILFVDGESRALGITDEVQALSQATGWPTWTTSFGKGLLSELPGNFHGIYAGDFAPRDDQSFFRSADLVLSFGPHYSSTNSSSFSAVPKPQVTIALSYDGVQLPASRVPINVSPKAVLSVLNKKLEQTATTISCHRYSPYPPNLSRSRISPIPDTTASSSSQPLSQDRLWLVLANLLRPHDVVLGETGTSAYGVRTMPLPAHARAFLPATWLSIGYMLPAAQGAALARRDDGVVGGRTVLFTGDGSFQMTVQAVSTILRHHLDVIVVVINNQGYTIERAIHGRKQAYNDVPTWRYAEAGRFFGGDRPADSVFGTQVRTWGELGAALRDRRLTDSRGLRILEVVLKREDVPAGNLQKILSEQKVQETTNK